MADLFHAFATDGETHGSQRFVNPEGRKSIYIPVGFPLRVQ
jgi:hypothetical protein